MQSKTSDTMVKIKFPLPENDASGGDAEWMWTDPVGENTFVLRNVPTFTFGLSYGDKIHAREEDGAFVFDGVVKRGGHSTYRAYAKSTRHNEKVQSVLQKLETLHCDLEPATDKIVGVDVLPEADIFAVYRVLEEAERDGILEFEEAHCGHVTEKRGDSVN